MRRAPRTFVIALAGAVLFLATPALAGPPFGGGRGKTPGGLAGGGMGLSKPAGGLSKAGAKGLAGKGAGAARGGLAGQGAGAARGGLAGQGLAGKGATPGPGSLRNPGASATAGGLRNPATTSGLGAGAAGEGRGFGERGQTGETAAAGGAASASSTRQQAADGAASESSTRQQAAASEDGVSGPRGGSVDVDQTSDGTSTTTTVTAESASGESATHTGTWSQENGTVSYDGSSSTSTGRSAETQAAGAMTDAGLVVGGTTTTNQGTVAGAALVNENGVKAAGIATDGETVKAGALSASGGTVTGTTVTATPGSGEGATVTTTTATYPASAGTSTTYYVYPYPVYGARVYTSAYGYPIYWWPVTPVVTAAVPYVVNGATTTLQASYSPVVTYHTQTAPVYATTYAPRGVYAQQMGDRYYWVPGTASSSPGVENAVYAASQMAGPTAGGTVIAYDVDGETVYLTNEPPAPGIHEEQVGSLHAWIGGVVTPTARQQAALGTAITAHASGGSEALAAASAQASNGG